MKYFQSGRILFFLLFSWFAIMQLYGGTQRFTISGTLMDAETGETLPYATVCIKGQPGGVVSNQYGFYSISCSGGTCELQVSFLGYENAIQKLSVNSDVKVNIELKPATETLEEVVVSSKQGIDETERRLSTVNMKEIKKMPALLGEPDVLRSIQNLPGVTSTAEIGRGFNVRGGAGDQNLMILDEAVVYNSTHLFGAYSVFNPDIVKNVKFYKSGIPATYGGRLSSVIDVTQKEGNMKSFKVNGSVGLISSRLTVEGPIVKDRISFTLAGRKSYIDNFFKYTSEESLVHDVKANFYDLNAKLNFILNDNNRLFLSSYSGNDILKVDDYDQQYGNTTSTLRFNHIYTSKLFSNTSVIISDYKMVDGESSENWSWEDKIGLKHYEFKHEFMYYTFKHNVEFGVDGIYYKFFPGELKPTDQNSNVKLLQIPTQHALESAVYLNETYSPTTKLQVQLGLRFSMFQYLGDEEIYTYQENIPRSVRTIVDTTDYGQNDPIQYYQALEPRLGIRYSFNENTSVKFSYNKTSQYLHLISNTTTTTPYDMWKPSNNNIKPMSSHQFALGYFTSVLKNSTEVSVETFYKKMYNVLEVRPGADIILNRTLDADLMEGEGDAYGVEVLLNKVTGRNTGSLSYTYSRSLREIDQIYSDANILPKGYYSSNYDIPHKVTFTYSYQSSLRGRFSTNFIYMTGRPVTLPDGQYIYFGTLVPYYSGINQHRLKDFHRLDVAYTVHCKKVPERKWTGYWVFSIYNLYARKNPYSVYITRQSGTRNTQAKQMSIFGTIVPSISFTFKF